MIRGMRPIALLLALAACVSVKNIPTLTAVTGVDLRRYSAKGFYFSDESYTGPHDAVGIIAVAQYAAATWVPDSAKWMLTPVRAQDVVDTVYARAAARRGSVRSPAPMPLDLVLRLRIRCRLPLHV